MKIRFCKGVTFMTEGGMIYLRKESENDRFSVGGAGVDFLDLVDGERTFDDIIEELFKIYGNAEPYTLVKDMDHFLQDLVTNGLLEVFSD